MKILGIESSCDDTSISIVDDNKNIIANQTVSQNQIHKEYKGVVPELAARNHVLFIDKILKKILKKNNLKIADIDLISATVGPGLIGGLLVGLTFAKTLSQVNKIPFSISQSNYFRKTYFKFFTNHQNFIKNSYINISLSIFYSLSSFSFFNVFS